MYAVVLLVCCSWLALPSVQAYKVVPDAACMEKIGIKINNTVYTPKMKKITMFFLKTFHHNT